MTVTHRSDVEGVSSSDTTVKPRRSKLFWGLIIGIPAACFASGLIAILSLDLLFSSVGSSMHSSTATTAPAQTPAAASTPTTSAASASPIAPVANANALNLPTESESDSPATVVNNLDGPDGIYVRMLQSDNPDYLIPYYYASTDATGYAGVMTLLTERATIHQQVLSNLVVPPTATAGSFTATFDIQDDTYPVAHYTVTYQWNPTANVWNVESSYHTS